MPKKLPDDLSASIEAEIARHPNGVGTDALRIVLADIVSRRTLQRRVASLVEQRRICAEGDGRAIKYRLAPIIGTANIVLKPVTMQASGEVYVPTSPEGEEVKSYVRQSIQGRKPMGYDRALLETYHPNETHYLPPEIRQHLHPTRHAEPDRIGSSSRRQESP